MGPVTTIAPSTGAPQVVPVRLAPAPVAEAVTTDLSPSKSVTAANNAAATRNDPSLTSSDLFQRTVLIDPATQDLIFRVIDVRSRQVVRQVPDEALLRMRAYVHALTEGKTTNEALTQADLEI